MSDKTQPDQARRVDEEQAAGDGAIREDRGQRCAIALHLSNVDLRHGLVLRRRTAGLVIERDHLPVAHQQAVDLARDHPVAHDGADRRLGQSIGCEERGERRVGHEFDHGLGQRFPLALVEVGGLQQAALQRAVCRGQRGQMLQQFVCGDAAQTGALTGGVDR